VIVGAGLLAGMMVLGQPRLFAALRCSVGQPISQAFAAVRAANAPEAR
jgi:hypothetical protein